MRIVISLWQDVSAGFRRTRRADPPNAPETTRHGIQVSSGVFSVSLLGSNPMPVTAFLIFTTEGSEPWACGVGVFLRNEGRLGEADRR